MDTLEIAIPAKWDGKWRVVVFDIPEKRRHRRHLMYSKLIELGFYPMQKSVLVHPFPCIAEVEFLKDTYEIRPYVHTLLVSEMPSGKVLYHFRNLLKEVL